MDQFENIFKKHLEDWHYWLINYIPEPINKLYVVLKTKL